jgi:nitrogen fixation protein FixH
MAPSPTNKQKKEQDMLSQKNKKSWRNPWFVSIVGVVATAVLVNAVLIWYAMHRQSTLVDHEYSSRDRKSDQETMSDIEAHNALAWQTSVKLPKSVAVAVPATFAIAVTDRQGVPVSGEMQVVAYRPSDAKKDFAVPFKEVSSGNYEGFISFPLKGYWELRIHVKRGNEDFEVESNKLLVADALQTN